MPFTFDAAATLLIYVCTTAALDDCQIYAVAQADGPRAAVTCSRELTAEADRWGADGFKHVAAVCVDQRGRDVTDIDEVQRF